MSDQQAKEVYAAAGLGHAVTLGSRPAVLVVDLIRPGNRGLAIVTSLAGLAIVALVIGLAGVTPRTAFGGAYEQDALTTLLDLLFVSIVALTIRSDSETATRTSLAPACLTALESASATA